MKTPCCGYEAKLPVSYPVYYNPGNDCVQCHNCGEPYVPVAISGMAAQRAIDLMKKSNAELREALAHYKNCPPPHPCIPEEKKEGS